MTTDKEIKPIISWFQSDIEPDDVEYEWEYILEELDEILKQLNPDSYWCCKGLI